MVEVQCWEVVGGADKGGIIVRSGRDTSSKQEGDRLATGAIVEELELVGERLHYNITEGKGPSTGWASIKLKNTELMSKTEKAMRLARKMAEEKGKKNAENGPGPHNGPTMVAFQAWLQRRHEENNPGETSKPEHSSREDQAEASHGSSKMQHSAADISKNIAPTGWLSRCGFIQVANFRDSAGPDESSSFKCAGGKIRRGLLYRTGQWNSATHPDLKRIRDEIGIKTYIDLRTGETFEGARAPCYDDEWYPPCPSGRQKDFRERQPGELRRIHCPFTRGLKMRPWTANEKGMKVKVDSSIAEDRRDTCSWWYQQMIRTEGFSDLVTSLSATMRAVLFMNYDEVLKAMKIMVDPKNFPVAYGCMAGKDRTGLLGQLVLSALGVSQEDILADYMSTNNSSAHISACIQVHMAMWHAELKEHQPKQFEMMVRHGQIPGGKTPTFSSSNDQPLWKNSNIVSNEENLHGARVYKEIMQYTFHVLDTECGGVINYLDSIGFGARDVEQMRAILVECESS